MIQADSMYDRTVLLICITFMFCLVQNRFCEHIHECLQFSCDFKGGLLHDTDTENQAG